MSGTHIEHARGTVAPATILRRCAIARRVKGVMNAVYAAYAIGRILLRRAERQTMEMERRYLPIAIRALCFMLGFVFLALSSRYSQLSSLFVVVGSLLCLIAIERTLRGNRNVWIPLGVIATFSALLSLNGVSSPFSGAQTVAEFAANSPVSYWISTGYLFGVAAWSFLSAARSPMS